MNELINEVKSNLALRTKSDQVQRLFHGRGGCFKEFKQVNIDYYPPVVVVLQYKEEEIDKMSLINSLEKELSDETTFYWQDRYVRGSQWHLLKGEEVKETTVSEGDSLYQITFGKNQNVGLFLDMKLGRNLVEKIAGGKKVANLFSYTCPFSIVALNSGAQSVLNMDMSKGALAVGKKNHIINNIDLKKVKLLSHDIFKSFGKLKKNGPFELLIIDPPSIQTKSFSLEKNYPTLIRRIPEFVSSGADVILCLNDPFLRSNFLLDIVSKECPELRLIEVLYSPDEFREVDKENGVKILHFKYA